MDADAGGVEWRAEAKLRGPQAPEEGGETGVGEGVGAERDVAKAGDTRGGSGVGERRSGVGDLYERVVLGACDVGPIVRSRSLSSALTLARLSSLYPASSPSSSSDSASSESSSSKSSASEPYFSFTIDTTINDTKYTKKLEDSHTFR